MTFMYLQSLDASLSWPQFLILTDVRREVTKLELSLEDTVYIVIHPVGGRRKLVENSFDE